MNKRKINIEELKIKPFNLNSESLMFFRTELKKLIEKRDFHKSCILQLEFDIEEIKEILDHAGLKPEMLEKWYKNEKS